MRHLHRAPLFAALALLLVLGCGSTVNPTVQPTPGQAARPAAAPASSPAAVSGLPSPAASPVAAASPAASPPPGRGPAPGAAAVRAGARAQLGPGSPAVRLELVSNAFQQPLFATHAGDGSGRLFVVEKRGRIVILREGALAPTPYLDLSGIVNSSASEQGLLGLAFHPQYAANGRFFVNYTDARGHTVVARYQVSAGDPNQADPRSAVQLLYIEQPAANHNGGMIAFGPDGYLYIGMGDGGRAGDPWGNAQNKGVLLGKMLRLDVDSAEPYAVPPDNPFVAEPGARPEIWAYGLRNPWRFSFDRATADLYIADVGQNAWEWVHFQRAGTGGGKNYGWNVMEGRHCYPPGRSCDPLPYVQPIAEYDRSGGCSITGGYVYRGPSFPQLAGLYFFSDYCSGNLWALQEQAPDQWRMELLVDTPLRVSSFGEDEAGEVYLTSFHDNGLYRLSAGP